MIFYYVIDRGRQDGVEEGDGVISSGFAVGRVIKVMDDTAQVQLLTDAKSSISVKTERGRVAGILTGKGYNLCEMNYVPKEEDIKTGDVVITSMLGGSFPEGIPAGKITNVRKDIQGLSMFIEVRPFADVFKIEDIIIIKKR
jgi:rod shape-determining protein MreC